MDYAAALRQSADETGAAIAALVDAIARKQVLETPKAINEYMALIGVPFSGRVTDRYEAARQIAEYLGRLPKGDAREKINAVTQFKTRDSSLQRWTDIIVKSD
jgi:hypothetical protein